MADIYSPSFDGGNVMTASKSKTRAIAMLIALLGAGCQSVPLSVELSSEVGKSVTALSEMQALARKRVYEAKILVQNLPFKDGGDALPSQLLAYKNDVEGKKSSGDIENFITLVCDDPKFPEIAQGLSSISELNKRIGKLAEPPKDTFVGISKAVRRDEAVLKELTELKGFSERMSAQLRADVAAKATLVSEKKDCKSIVGLALKRRFVGKEPQGGAVSATSIFGVFESAVALAKAIYGVQESALRERALRAFAIGYEDDILYSLMLVDGRMSPFAFGSDVKPKQLFTFPADPSQNRFVLMLEQHQSAMFQRGFIAFSELANNSSLSNLDRLRASEAIETAVGEALTIDPSSGVELTSTLSDLWGRYFSALKNGSGSKAEALDALIEAEAGLSGLLNKFNDFKKSLGDL